MPVLVPAVVRGGALSGRPQPVLVAGEWRLRPWSEQDVVALVAAYADPDIQRWHARSMTAGEAREWIRSRALRWADESGADWAVVDAGDAVVGRVALRVLILAEGHAEAGYWVVPAARGRGVAGAALEAMSTWLVEQVGLHRIELAHSTRNQASCRVAVKAGFAPEGTKRSQTLHVDGWHDMHLHARVWPDAAEAGLVAPTLST